MSLLNFLKNKTRNVETKTSKAGPLVAMNTIGRPKWTARRYDALAEEGFKKNVIAYRCVRMVASAAATVPWLLYDRADNEIETHPLLDLLHRPNPMQDGVTFLENLYSSLELSGNAYIEAVPSHDDGCAAELYVLRADRMKVIPGATGLPMGYEYSAHGQTSRWAADPLTGQSAILHIKHFHPLDDWYGMAPLEAASVSIDQHNAASAWNQALLGQGARPSGALVFAPKEGPATLSEEQITRLRDEMDHLYQGAKNVGRPLILEGGLEWQEMSLSPKDMDWLAGRNIAARDIALAFGVPSQMIGLPDQQTYSNMQEARLAFYEDTVLPLVGRVTSALDHWLSPTFGADLFLDYDLDSISALNTRRESLWDKVQNADFLSVNEKRAALGYPPVE